MRRMNVDLPQPAPKSRGHSDKAFRELILLVLTRIGGKANNDGGLDLEGTPAAHSLRD